MPATPASPARPVKGSHSGRQDSPPNRASWSELICASPQHGPGVRRGWHRTPVFDVLAETPVLTLFLVVAVRHARRTDPIRSDPLWVRLALRFLVGLITLPIGPVSLSLAVTAGPLLVGIAL